MTRKRFVKLTMGLGYPRNFAGCNALITRMSGYTYADAWGIVKPTDRILRSLDRLTPEEKAMHADLIKAAEGGRWKV